MSMDRRNFFKTAGGASLLTFLAKCKEKHDPHGEEVKIEDYFHSFNTDINKEPTIYNMAYKLLFQGSMICSVDFWIDVQDLRTQDLPTINSTITEDTDFILYPKYFENDNPKYICRWNYKEFIAINEHGGLHPHPYHEFEGKSIGAKTAQAFLREFTKKFPPVEGAVKEYSDLQELLSRWPPFEFGYRGK